MAFHPRPKVAPTGDLAQHVRGAHPHSIDHHEAILASERCGCFYCLAIYPPAEIDGWCDDGKTALCPRCHIDSVIGTASGYPIERVFLEQMRVVWFGSR